MTRRASFSLLEIMVAVSVLTVAILGSLAAVASASSAEQLTRESEVAHGLLADALEQLRGADPDEVANVVWLAPDLDGVANTAEMDLPVVASILQGARRSVRVLSEAEAETATGQPATTLDFDGDGAAGEADAESDRTRYTIVPLRVTLSWTSIGGGARTLTAMTFIYAKG